MFSGPERRDRTDLKLAGALAGVVFLLLSIWAYPFPHPSSWAELAVAAGVRPADVVFPGLWRAFASVLFSFLPIKVATFALVIAGRLMVAADAALFYFLLTRFVPAMLRSAVRPHGWIRIARGILFLSALLFACSDSVWRAGQIATQTSFNLFLLLSCLALFAHFLRTGSLRIAHVCLVCLGALSAETSGGLLLTAFCAFVVYVRLNRASDPAQPLMNPLVLERSKWGMTAVFGAGFFATVLLNLASFIIREGMVSGDLSYIELPVAYVVRYWELLSGAATPAGWSFLSLTTLGPFLMAVAMAGRATDEDAFLQYRTGLLILLAAILSLSQLSALPVLWAWTWIPSAPAVRGEFLKCGSAAFAAAAFALSMVVLAMDLYCRNHRRIALQRFPEAFENSPVGSRRLKLLDFMRSMRRPLLIVAPVVLLLLTVPARVQSRERTMLGILRDYVAETLSEAGDAKYLFTDGSSDAVLALGAAARKMDLRVVSMMSDKKPRASYIRARGVEDEEDRLLLESSASDALRTWVYEKPSRLKECALQLGFEFWKRGVGSGGTTNAHPVCSGVLGRPGMEQSAAAEGRMAARKLAERIFDAHVGRFRASRCPDWLLREQFAFAEWRIARMARMYAEELDRAGETAKAVESTKFADKLDDCNPTVSRLRRNMDWFHKQKGPMLTPREGLRLALQRADFQMARRYAIPILNADPDEPNANFGMGMSYLLEQQYARAELHFRRCFVRNPAEPAVWNNLAIALYRSDKLDEANRAVTRALELLPDSPAVKQTAEEIRTAIARRDESRAIREAR